MPEVKISYMSDKSVISVSSKVKDIRIKHQKNGDAVIEFPDKNGVCCLVVSKENIIS